jgi:hypothetical protein
MMRNRTGLIAVLAASHGVNDLIAGWLLGGHLPSASAWDRLPWLVIYAALAFAGQLPAAWLVDRSRRQDRWLAGALALMIVAVAAVPVSPGLAIVVSGMASALCHVAGGALALQLPRGARALGWFSAPGVLGLTAGGYLGGQGVALGPAVALAPAALGGGWAALRAQWPQSESTPNPTLAPGADAHDGLMLLILLVLTLRSALWDLVQIAHAQDPRVLAAVAVSAAIGKVLGGWLIERWPSVRHVSVTLLASCVLLAVGRQNTAGLCLGVGLLQSTIPASIVLLHRSFGASAARASACGLGVTVVLGGLVLPMGLGPGELAIAVVGAALLLFWRTSRARLLAAG